MDKFKTGIQNDTSILTEQNTKINYKSWISRTKIENNYEMTVNYSKLTTILLVWQNPYNYFIAW